MQDGALAPPCTCGYASYSTSRARAGCNTGQCPPMRASHARAAYVNCTSIVPQPRHAWTAAPRCPAASARVGTVTHDPDEPWIRRSRPPCVLNCSCANCRAPPSHSCAIIVLRTMAPRPALPTIAGVVVCEQLGVEAGAVCVMRSLRLCAVCLGVTVIV